MAETTQSDSATGTTQADVAAAARVAAAAAQTAATQAAAAASGALAQQETVGDIEATNAYTINMKKLVDVFTAIDHRIIQNAITFDQQMSALAVQAVANNNALANRVNNGAIDNDVRSKGNDEAYDKGIDSANISEREETVRVGKVADDRTWNIDEVAALIAKNPIYLDALAAVVATKLADTSAPKA